MKYAIYQMDVIAKNPKKNRLKVKDWIEKTVKKDRPDVIVLPEMWTTAFALPELKDIADVEGEPTSSFLKNIAKQFEINIIGGSFANIKGNSVYNTSIVIDKEGKIVYEYDKIHLVPMLDEHNYLTGGKEKVETFELEGIKMGIIICYDLRFPELARKLALEGAKVLHVVAAWPTPRKDHWKSLLISRAIENQMFVVSCNRVGTYNNEVFAGTSMVIDPWGTTLKEGRENREETIFSDISLDEVSKIRKEVPVFSSRVPRLY